MTFSLFHKEWSSLYPNAQGPENMKALSGGRVRSERASCFWTLAFRRRWAHLTHYIWHLSYIEAENGNFWKKYFHKTYPWMKNDWYQLTWGPAPDPGIVSTSKIQLKLMLVSRHLSPKKCASAVPERCVITSDNLVLETLGKISQSGGEHWSARGDIPVGVPMISKNQV